MFAVKGARGTCDHAAEPASMPFLRGILASIEVVGRGSSIVRSAKRK